MTYSDRTLTCRDCAQEFVFPASEQEFFASRGFTNDPGRCPDCRAARRASRGEAAPAEGYGETAAADGGRREYHMTICAECGGQARLPFVPRFDRPVYCSSCFDKVRAYR